MRLLLICYNIYIYTYYIQLRDNNCFYEIKTDFLLSVLAFTDNLRPLSSTLFTLLRYVHGLSVHRSARVSNPLLLKFRYATKHRDFGRPRGPFLILIRIYFG